MAICSSSFSITNSLALHHWIAIQKCANNQVIMHTTAFILQLHTICIIALSSIARLPSLAAPLHRPQAQTFPPQNGLIQQEYPDLSC